MKWTDRQVHAVGETVEVVRYDRAGKWFVEKKDDTSRAPVTVVQAARLTVDSGLMVRWKQPGGRAFRSHIRRMGRKP